MSRTLRRVGLVLVAAAAALPLFGGDAPGVDPIVGAFAATGAVTLKLKSNGQISEQHGMLEETFTFYDNHYAHTEILTGGWKHAKGQYSADFSKAAKLAIQAGLPPKAKVKAKVKLSQLVPTETELTGTLFEKQVVKLPGLKNKLTVKGTFVGVRAAT